MRGSQRGVTLIELMVVLAIVALLGAMLFGVESRTYGASAQNVSDQLISTISLAKMRAVSSRRIHQLEVLPQEVLLWQSPKTGLAMPGFGEDWQLVQRVGIPNGVAVWDVLPNALGSGQTVSRNAALDYEIYFKPDGSSTGGTLFVTDEKQAKSYRVLVYK